MGCRVLAGHKLFSTDMEPYGSFTVSVIEGRPWTVGDEMMREAYQLTDVDSDFLAATAGTEIRDKARLKQIIEADEDFREAFLCDDRTWQRVMTDKEIFLKISPKLYFEILLRKSRKELEAAGHTIEKAGSRKIAVFDTGEVVALLSKPAVVVYLADMLASFSKIRSYSFTVRVKRGVWRTIRFNDQDIVSLISFSERADEEYRFGLFKRIADLCLFVLGVFPEYVDYTYRYPSSGKTRPPILGKARWSADDYMERGKQFYRLAAGHPAARQLQLAEVFELFHDHLRTAQKPLNFIAIHYLGHTKNSLFGTE